MEMTKPHDSKKRKAIRLVVSMLVLASNVFADDARICEYLSNGTVLWNDSSKWKDGIVPAEGDTVSILGQAQVTDADSEIIANLNAIILLNANSVITFNNTDDFHVPMRITGKGKIVKDGSGRLYFDEAYVTSYHTGEGIEVNNGELYLLELPADKIPGGLVEQKMFSYGPLTVNAPGKIFLRPTGYSMTCGINGDGVITNTFTPTKEQSACQLYFTNNVPSKLGTSYSFSGILSPNVHPTFIGVERQDFVSDLPYNYSVRCTEGTVGLTKFGNQGESGSLGTARLGVQANKTEKPFRFVYLGTGESSTRQFRVFGSNPGFVIDGGAFGGLELTGDFYLTHDINKSQALILDGTNVTPCTLSGNIFEARDYSKYQGVAWASSTIIKRGSGTWRMAPSLKIQGVVAVEGGVLEAQKLAEKGTYCSLGDASILLEPLFGKSREELKEVPYAVLLGDGTSDGEFVGTLSYAGTKEVDLHSRTIALSGSGRLRNATSLPFTWRGITSLAEGGHALHLDGAGTENRAASVTNGIGKITVVKEGAGTWTLDDDIDVSAFDVRGGVLNVHLGRFYYRFNVKKLWSEAETSMLITRFALFDKDNNCRNLGLVHNKAADGNVSGLEPGQVAFWMDTISEAANRPLSNAFLDNNESCQIFQTGIKPSPDNEDTWIRFVMRPSCGTPIAKYDIRGGVRGTITVDEPNGRLPKIWTLEGSVDGVNWTEISAPSEDQPHSKYDEDPYLWMSSKTTDYRTGFSVNSLPISTLEVDCVSVSGGGTLCAFTPLATSRLRCDPTAGGGTIKGVKFAESGVLEVEKILPGNIVTHLPVVFEDCEGLNNLAAWPVEVGGCIRSKFKTVLTSDGRLSVTSVGMTVVIR